MAQVAHDLVVGGGEARWHGRRGREQRAAVRQRRRLDERKALVRVRDRARVRARVRARTRARVRARARARANPNPNPSPNPNPNPRARVTSHRRGRSGRRGAIGAPRSTGARRSAPASPAAAHGRTSGASERSEVVPRLTPPARRTARLSGASGWENTW